MALLIFNILQKSSLAVRICGLFSLACVTFGVRAYYFKNAHSSYKLSLINVLMHVLLKVIITLSPGTLIMKVQSSCFSKLLTLLIGHRPLSGMRALGYTKTSSHQFVFVSNEPASEASNQSEQSSPTNSQPAGQTARHAALVAHKKGPQLQSNK